MLALNENISKCYKTGVSVTRVSELSLGQKPLLAGYQQIDRIILGYNPKLNNDMNIRI
jgi:hypothetical protein